MVEDVNNGKNLVILTWTLLFVSGLIICARLYTRAFLIKALGWDDWFMVLALACSAVNSALITISISFGTGRHQAFLTEVEKTQANKYNWISQAFHIMSTNWAKVSIVLFLLRLIQPAKRQTPYFYGGMALLTISNVICVYSIFGQCIPMRSLWNHSIEGECWSPKTQRNFAFSQGAISAFSDLVLAVYPVHLISRLQMPLRLKLALGSILALGIIAMAVAIVKTKFLVSLSARADYSWNTIDLVVWACIEQYLIIIAACIPTLGSFIRLVFSKRSSTRETRAWSASSLQHPLQQMSHPQNTINLPNLRIDTFDDYANTFDRTPKCETTIQSCPSPDKRDYSDGRQEPVICEEENRTGIFMTRDICVEAEDKHATKFT